jgi:hypothetical protein
MAESSFKTGPRVPDFGLDEETGSGENRVVLTV